MAYTFTAKIDFLICSECGYIISEDKYECIPKGTTFTLEIDGYKKSRVFCSQKEYESFYSKHPEERFNRDDNT